MNGLTNVKNTVCYRISFPAALPLRRYLTPAPTILRIKRGRWREPPEYLLTVDYVSCIRLQLPIDQPTIYGTAVSIWSIAVSKSSGPLRTMGHKVNSIHSSHRLRASGSNDTVWTFTHRQTVSDAAATAYALCGHGQEQMRALDLIGGDPMGMGESPPPFWSTAGHGDL